MGGKTSRNKGNQYERDIRNELLRWFPECVTSRYGSKELDDKCVDLMHTEPFNFQLKAWKSAPNLHKELKKMPKGSDMNILMHKRPREGTIVAMSKEDFYEILNILKLNSFL